VIGILFFALSSFDDVEDDDDIERLVVDRKILFNRRFVPVLLERNDENVVDNIIARDNRIVVRATMNNRTK